MYHTIQHSLQSIVLENSSITGIKWLCKYSDFHNILNHLGQGDRLVTCLPRYYFGHIQDNLIISGHLHVRDPARQ